LFVVFQTKTQPKTGRVVDNFEPTKRSHT
jgi:hypothetical protein